MSAPKVSIIITCFNKAGLVRAAIESALAQDYQNLEIICVDDGSTDGSASVIREYQDRLSLFRQANSGQGGAANTGYRACTGDWILFLDADDILQPTAISTAIAHAAPQVSLVMFALEVQDVRTGTVTGKLPKGFLPKRPARELVLRYGYHPFSPTSGNVFKRDFLEKMMPLSADHVPRAIDFYLCVFAPFFGEIRFLPEPLGILRRYDESIQATAVGIEGKRKMLQVRCYILEELERMLTREGNRRRGWSPIFLYSHWRMRLVSFRYDPDQHPCAGDTWFGLLYRALRCVMLSPEFSGLGRAKGFVIILVIGFSPKCWIVKHIAPLTNFRRGFRDILRREVQGIAGFLR